MQGYNHIAGGLVFTGIFSSFHDVNVFSSPLLIGTTVACALLPDIDHTQSVIGKTFYPIASFLQTRFGNRTITHSLFFYVACVGLLWLTPPSYTVCGAYALLSHLLFDMCTKQGVPLLYPFSKRPFVLPANPDLRLSAQDHRSEAIVFVVFIALGSFCQPLMANGFWTTYNEAFATWEHAEREARRGRDLIRVSWRGSDKRIRRGYFLRADGTTMIVLTPSGFELPRSTQTNLIDMAHSGIVATEHHRMASHITIDSVNRLLMAHCLRAQIQSADELTYYEQQVMKVSKFMDLEYRKDLVVSQTTHDTTDVLTKIQLLNLQREAEQQQFTRDWQLYQQTMQTISLYQMALQKLADEFLMASDYRKGEIIAQRQNLTQKLTSALTNEPFPPISPNLARFDLQKRLLQKQLEHDSRISANLITLTTSKPLR